MKKTLIALTLATLPVAAMAEVVLYGQIKGGYEVSSAKRSNGTRGPWVNGIVDYGSRIGFKGQEDLGNGLKAIWQLEQRVDIAGGRISNTTTYTDAAGTVHTIPYTGSRGFGTRDSFIGLEGGFGKVRVGHLSNYINSDMNDVDQWEYYNEALGLGKFGRHGTRRVSVRYDSPDLAGFNVSAQYSPRDNNAPSRYTGNAAVLNGEYFGGRDKYGLGLGYANSGFFVKYGMEYLKHNARNANGKFNGQVHQLEGGYDANNIFAALGLNYSRNTASYATRGDNNADVGERVSGREVALTGGYHFGNVFPKISYAHGWDVRSTEGGKPKLRNTKYDQIVLGADYSFSKRTSANAQVGWLREGLGVNAAGVSNGKATSTAFGAGLKHKF